MARKRLTKGTNALRVEERIAKVPLDLARPPPEGETGIFEALRALELRADADEAGETPVPPPKPGRGRDAKATRAPLRRTPSPGGATPRRPTAEPVDGTPGSGPARLGPASFSRAERRVIALCCTEYRNRLPTYLLSVQGELEIIDSILRKCSRAERDGKRGRGDGPDPGA